MKTLIKTLSPATVLVRTGIVAALLSSAMFTSSVARTVPDVNTNLSTDKNKEWYIRLTASSAEGLKDRSNILGQLTDSVAGYDSHDLLEINPFGSSYLTIVFIHEDWEEHSGTYSSDFRNIETKNMMTWDFSVKTDDASRTVTLDCDIPVLPGSTETLQKQTIGIAALSDAMWLKEVSTGRYYRAYVSGEAQSYDFEMNGENLKSFQWIYDPKNSIEKAYNKQPEQIITTAEKLTKPVKEKEYSIIDLPPSAGKKEKE